MSKSEYNYVIVGLSGYYSYGYKDIIDNPNVAFFEDYTKGIDNPITRLVLRLNFWKYTNKIIKTPFAKFVYPKMYANSFDKLSKICFLFFGGNQTIYQTSYLEYVRRTYPKVKLVLYMQDLIERNKALDFDNIRSKFDLIMTYDKNDAVKYGIVYYPTPMSVVDVEINKNLKPSDIYFCGEAKTRYPLIHQLFKIFTSQGLRCDFNILLMPKDAPIIDGINYPDKRMTYEENIQHIKAAKCILEIMQDGAVGYTPRLWESIVYERLLLTNNVSIKQSEFNNPQYIRYTNNLTNIKDWINETVMYSESYKKSLSPIRLLEFIEQKINEL